MFIHQVIANWYLQVVVKAERKVSASEKSEPKRETETRKRIKEPERDKGYFYQV